MIMVPLRQAKTPPMWRSLTTEPYLRVNFKSFEFD